MDHSHRDDDFEGFAPTRRVDRGARPDPARPDWLTGTGQHEELNLPTSGQQEFVTGAVDDSGAGHESGAELGSPARPASRAGARGAKDDSWENAVEHVAQDDESPVGESGAGSYGAARRPSRASGASALQSILTRLSQSPPLVFVALAVIAVVALMMFHPRADGEQTVSIAAIHKHPERFDGRPVKVRGRVGEVYEVGGGYAFHLYQGRDDIVVFTRSRVPVRREELTIEGSISNGMLDGKPRQALFETAH